MPDHSPRLALPLLAAGQAQKEIVHNEALIRIDALAQPAARSAGANHPPADPEDGECWIIGSAPDADWAGHPHAIAIRSAGGWRFVAARDGMAMWVVDRSLTARFAAGAWRYGVEELAEVRVAGVKIIGEQQPAISTPGGGATIDTEARVTIEAMLVMLRNHGLIAI